MKILLIFSIICLLRSISVAQEPRNLFVVTIDGFRWQELFRGADSALLSDTRFTSDTATSKALYWDSDPQVRRKKLLPFFWSVLANKGKLIGNRDEGSLMNVANPYHLSYAGYSEMFTGRTDLRLMTNEPRINPNENIFTQLNRMEAYKGRVALFSSWNVFPFILPVEKEGFYINSGYAHTNDSNLQFFDQVQKTLSCKEATRYDWLTWIAAREYLDAHKPRVFCLALGETDEWAHQKRYDRYLHHANAFDRMLAELWNWIQSTPGYKNNTVLIVTTDHGRGRKTNSWHKHGMLVGGSSETWMVCVNPPGSDNINLPDMTARYYQYELPRIMMASLEQQPTALPAETITLTQTSNHAAGRSK
jgi:hypothetical protein